MEIIALSFVSKRCYESACSKAPPLLPHPFKIRGGAALRRRIDRYFDVESERTFYSIGLYSRLIGLKKPCSLFVCVCVCAILKVNTFTWRLHFASILSSLGNCYSSSFQFFDESVTFWFLFSLFQLFILKALNLEEKFQSINQLISYLALSGSESLLNRLNNSNFYFYFVYIQRYNTRATHSLPFVSITIRNFKTYNDGFLLFILCIFESVVLSRNESQFDTFKLSNEIPTIGGSCS